MNRKHLLALLCFICAAVAAYADGPFRNHRYDTFKVMPITEQSIVFVGNSITDMHLWYEAWGNDTRIVNRGNSGGLSSEILANARSYCAGHPAKIFMMIGTNDSPSSQTAPTIVGNIEKTIKVIQAESPSTEIYIESLLPSTNNRSLNGIKAVNNAIQEMLANYPGVTYVDLYSKLVGKIDTNNAYSFDQLHITAAGYQIWMAEIEQYMGGAKSLYPANTVSLQNAQGVGGSHGMRTTYFSMMPIEADDVLFFGDEMVKNGEWQELLRNAHVKNRGTGWGYEKTYTVMTTVSANVDATFGPVSGVKKEEPKQVLLYTGTGEVNGSQAISTIVTNYKAVVKKIRKYAPNAKISLVGLMPTQNYNNSRVKQFNSQIQDYAIEQDNVEFIDLYSTLATASDLPKGEYFAAGDDYLYGDGYIAVSQVLARYIEGCQPVSAKEASAYRDLIKGVVPKVKPVATILDKQVDDAPYVLTDEEAAPFLACNGKATVVIDYSLPTPVSGHLALVGASDKDATDHTFSVVARDNGSMGVRYYGLENHLEGWYTGGAGLGSGSHKIVIVMDPEVGYKYYSDGTYIRDVAASALGAYGFAHFGNVGANTVSLGGIVTSAGTSLGGKVNFKSVRLYDEALTDAQIAELSYSFGEGGEELGPETVTYIVDAENGFLQRNDGSVNANWNTYWYSNQEPTLELSAGVNNMCWSDNDVQMETGSAASATYTFRAPNGYLIRDVKFTAKAKTSASVQLTFDGDTYTTSTEGQTFEKTDINRATQAFSLSGKNGNSTLLSDCTVTVVRKDLVETDIDASEEPEAFTIFATPSSGGVPYRIPAVCTAKDGALVAIADYRYSRADIGSGRIDLHIRRSLDNGKTWEKDIIMPANMTGDGKCSNANDWAGFGDPCMVADRETGRILVMSCAGYPGFFQCTRQQHQRCARWYSDDNGLTWTGPDFIDNVFVFEPLDDTTFGPAQGMFFGSGKIHQSRYVKVGDYYRLYAANSVRNGNGVIRNYVMYSDDFGQNWHFLGGKDNPAVASSGDEPKVEELPNGNVIFSGRRNGQGGRNFNIFQFTDREKAEGKWMGVAVSSASTSGISNDNACNGEIQLVPVVNKQTGARHYLALQSVPFGSGRSNVGIFWKALDEGTDYSSPANFAKKWDGSHQASFTTSCYSTMTVQADNTIGFVYEENSKNNGYDIQYKRYTIECLTDGKYAYDAEYVPEITIEPIRPLIFSPEAGTVDKLDVVEITFNNDIKLQKGSVTLAEGVKASLKTHTDNKKLLTVTLETPITEPGNYTLTFPASLLKDNDGQLNESFTVSYRILPVAQPLGDTVTDLSEVSNHKTYALYNPHFTAYAIYAPEQSETAVWAAGMIGDASHAVANPTYSEECNFADPNTSWMLIEHKDLQYLYNVGAQQFVKVARPTTLVADASPILVIQLTDGFAFNTTGGAQDFMCAAPQLSEPIAVWTSADAGSCWQLVENPNVADDYVAAMTLIDPSALAGVEAITAGSPRATIYDVQGRRLQALPTRRGFYIVDGKKVMK